MANLNEILIWLHFHFCKGKIYFHFSFIAEGKIVQWHVSLLTQCLALFIIFCMLWIYCLDGNIFITRNSFQRFYYFYTSTINWIAFCLLNFIVWIQFFRLFHAWCLENSCGHHLIKFFLWLLLVWVKYCILVKYFFAIFYILHIFCMPAEN